MPISVMAATISRTLASRPVRPQTTGFQTQATVRWRVFRNVATEAPPRRSRLAHGAATTKRSGRTYECRHANLHDQPLRSDNRSADVVALYAMDLPQHPAPIRRPLH